MLMKDCSAKIDASSPDDAASVAFPATQGSLVLSDFDLNVNRFLLLWALLFRGDTRLFVLGRFGGIFRQSDINSEYVFSRIDMAKSTMTIGTSQLRPRPIETRVQEEDLRAVVEHPYL